MSLPKPSVESILMDYVYKPELIEKVSHRKTPVSLKVADPDPSWPQQYQVIKARIISALGDGGGGPPYLEHVGSTSVLGLSAKNVIDIDMIVLDASDEASYVPALEAHAGFQLLTREPHYYEHRLLISYDPPANLHVYCPGSAEVVRHRLFRDRLIRSASDRKMYGRAKKQASDRAAEMDGKMSTYTSLKEQAVREILGRAFQDAGYSQ